MVTTFYPPYNFGGDGIFVKRLATALANDGHDVHVVYDLDAYAVCAGDEPTADLPDDVPGITRHVLGGAKPNTMDLVAVHQLGRPMGKRKQLAQLLDQDFDVLHFHNVSLIGGPEVLKLGKGVKLCTLHDHWFVCATHALWRFDSEACTQRTCFSCSIAAKRPPQLWRWTQAVADAGKNVTFIAPSKFAKQSHINNGFPATIRVLPHFMPDSFVAEKLSSANEQPAHSRPYFLFVGRLEKLKGAQFLIEQFQTYDAADLIIAGRGGYEKELMSMAAGLDHVHFAGKVAVSRLNQLYRQAIAAIVPSLCYETFGLVPLEAFAQATPAIVSNRGALPEVIAGGGGVSYNDGPELIAAMEKLRSNDSLQRQLGAEGLANLEANYTQQRHLLAYYDMIAELTGSRSMQEVT
jgi:glycosyltransferase involved in cell wall biosynthesis